MRQTYFGMRPPNKLTDLIYILHLCQLFSELARLLHTSRQICKQLKRAEPPKLQDITHMQIIMLSAVSGLMYEN